MLFRKSCGHKQQTNEKRNKKCRVFKGTEVEKTSK